jgi:hypothetical protein
MRVLPLVAIHYRKVVEKPAVLAVGKCSSINAITSSAKDSTTIAVQPVHPAEREQHEGVRVSVAGSGRRCLSKMRNSRARPSSYKNAARGKPLSKNVDLPGLHRCAMRHLQRLPLPVETFAKEEVFRTVMEFV